MKKFILFIALFAIIGFHNNFYVPTTNAQTFVPYTIDDAKKESYLTISPEYPRPGENFTVTINSFAVDLKSSDIKFYENGTLIQEATGVNSANFSNKSERTNIRVTVTSPESIVINKTETIIPGSISIIWQAYTYTPPFYKGRSLYSTESPFHISAITDLHYSNGNKIPNSDIIFNWKINGKTINQSGLGNSDIYIEEKFLSSNLNIELEARSTSQNAFATENTVLRATRPEIRYYQSDPLLGVNWFNVINSVNLEQETTIVAIPFGFNVQRPDNLDYTWSNNGDLLDTSSHMVTFRNETGPNQTAEYNINTLAQKIGSIFQSAKNNLTIFAE